MPTETLQEARNILEIAIGPEEIIEKVPELGFKSMEELLKANNLKKTPDLPSQEKLKEAKEQNKALVFRVGKDGSGKDITLEALKEKFGGLIYSKWYLQSQLPMATEPLATGWALVDLDCLPGSTDKTYDEQKKFIKDKGLKLKSPVADAYDLLVAFKVTGKYYRSGHNNARTEAIVKNEPVKISHFDKGGMCISTGWGKTVKSPEIGAATEMELSA